MKPYAQCRVCDAHYTPGEYRDHVRGLTHVRVLEARKGQRAPRLLADVDDEAVPPGPPEASDA